MKLFLAVLFVLVAGSLSFALPTALDTCQTNILLNEIITLCILAIIIGILFKAVVSVVGFEVSNTITVMLIGIAIVIILVYAFFVGGMRPCVPLPS